MARCAVTLKSTTFGNNVSHACNRTRRRFKSNIHKKKYRMPLQDQTFLIKTSKKGLRTLDKNSALITLQRICEITSKDNLLKKQINGKKEN